MLRALRWTTTDCPLQSKPQSAGTVVSCCGTQYPYEILLCYYMILYTHGDALFRRARKPSAHAHAVVHRQ